MYFQVERSQTAVASWTLNHRKNNHNGTVAGPDMAIKQMPRRRRKQASIAGVWYGGQQNKLGLAGDDRAK